MKCVFKYLHFQQEERINYSPLGSKVFSTLIKDTGGRV